MDPVTLCVTVDTERPWRRSHAERGNDQQVCVGLLAGRTAPELAEQLALKVNTIESYLKRAAIKLGISGRHSLLRWMYSTED